MSKTISLFYFSQSQYSKEELFVHLVWCHNKDKTKAPHVLPILAPANDSKEFCYGVENPETGKTMRFSLDTYIKASAKKIITGEGIKPKSRHPDCWSEDEYDFTGAKISFGSLQDCINHGRSADIKYFSNSTIFDFNGMLASWVVEEGTIPVTWEQLEAAKKEVEKPILNEEIPEKKPSKKSTQKSSKKT